jgi:hypothetical protein
MKLSVRLIEECRIFGKIKNILLYNYKKLKIKHISKYHHNTTHNLPINYYN